MTQDDSPPPMCVYCGRPVYPSTAESAVSTWFPWRDDETASTVCPVSPDRHHHPIRRPA